MIIVLLGYMGVGKTTIGQQLASILNYSFVDLDTFIEKKEQLTVSEIFKTKGEIYFRKKEHQYLKEILSTRKKIILATGGGTPCYSENMQHIIENEETTSFYLQLSPILLATRLFTEKENRPLIKDIDTIEKLTEFIAIHLFERQTFYGAATYTIPVSNLSIQQTIEEVVEQLY